MKYLGKITDNKDLVTKEYADSTVIPNCNIVESSTAPTNHSVLWYSTINNKYYYYDTVNDSWELLGG